MIEGKGIKKTYGNLQVLKGIDIFIKPSEVVAIVGPSGAGKSTLLQILGTLDTADSGDVEIEGVNCSKLSRNKLAELRNRKLGFVFQFHHLLPEFNALENVCIPAFIKGTPVAEAEKEATRILNYLGLKDRLTHKPSAMSGGEQQRVAVARALINNPKVIFADEPSGNLDSKNAEELHQLFFNLRNEFGQTFVIVTHNETLARQADRTIKLVDGLLSN